MNTKLKSFPGPGRLAMTLLLAGCLAAAAQDVGVFTPTGSLITARNRHTATLLPNGQVLVAGGNSDTTLSSAELYDPAAGVWSATGDLGIPENARRLHTATLLPNGQVLVAGGYNYNGPLAGAELYDPATGYWTPTGSLGFARGWHTATLLPNGKVLVAGGDDYNGPLASAELYDLATGFWTRTGSLGTARASDTATLLPNGQVLVAGGVDYYGNSFASTELYDPVTGTWSPTGSLTNPHGNHTATLLTNGKVLIAGGWGTNDDSLASAELYDPATGSWTPTGSMGTVYGNNTATLLPNGMVLVAAGSVEIYDPEISVLNPTFNHPIILGDGSFQFGFINASGPSYSVLASPDAGAPMNSWLNLGPATETALGSGLFRFTDPQAPDYPQRFYRVTSP